MRVDELISILGRLPCDASIWITADGDEDQWLSVKSLILNADGDRVVLHSHADWPDRVPRSIVLRW